MFRTIYIGADNFSANVLNALVKSGRCEIVTVGTYPDIQRGRGHKYIPTPVKTTAIELGIPVLEIPDVNDAQIHSRMAKFGVSVGIIVSFKIVPKEFLSAIPGGFVNLHPSLLPDLPGAAPVQWAIMHGYSQSGMTTFVVDEKIDAGRILLQKKFEIGMEETAGEVFDRIAPDGAQLLADLSLIHI